MNIAIIGGGAAGFFAAVNIKEMSPETNVTIFEKSSIVLSKLSISGGGRCNVTNSFAEISDLSKAYPRGDKLIKRAFKTFDQSAVCRWFEEHGVNLVTQADQCVFPRSQNSQTIIDCFLRLSSQLGVVVKCGCTLQSIEREKSGYRLFFEDNNTVFDRVVITTGGNPKRESFDYIERLGHTIVSPVPSLFTFNIPNDPIRELMGIVVEQATISLQGTKIKASGALLVTHWGMSGPAVLKLSSYGAVLLNERDYRFSILVNWVGESSFDVVATAINRIISENPQKYLSNIRPYDLSSRLWSFLLRKADLAEDKRWGELGKKGFNKLINILTNDEYLVHGRGVFRDEFVTCGGVSLDSINYGTMESKVCSGLYFAGEVLDIDGITGGFNFQAAWTTAYLTALSIVGRLAKCINF